MTTSRKRQSWWSVASARWSRCSWSRSTSRPPSTSASTIWNASSRNSSMLFSWRLEIPKVDPGYQRNGICRQHLSMLPFQRKKIVNGEHEPSDEEAKQPLIHGLSEEDQKVGLPKLVSWPPLVFGAERVRSTLNSCSKPKWEWFLFPLIKARKKKRRTSSFFIGAGVLGLERTFSAPNTNIEYYNRLPKYGNNANFQALYDSSGSDEGEVGIPEFWLHCLKSNEATCDLIQEHDEPILKHLTDITAHCTTEPVVRR